VPPTKQFNDVKRESHGSDSLETTRRELETSHNNFIFPNNVDGEHLLLGNELVPFLLVQLHRHKDISVMMPA
jgi:hypothetical protein